MTILIVLVALVFAEYCYSRLKKDSVYSFESLRTNFVTQLFGTIKDIFIPVLGVIGITLLLYGHIPKLFSIPQNIFTLVAAVVLMDFFITRSIDLITRSGSCGCFTLCIIATRSLI